MGVKLSCHRRRGECEERVPPLGVGLEKKGAVFIFEFSSKNARVYALL